MAPRIGEDAEGDSRHVLRRLDDLAAELLRACKCLLDVLDTHEEKDRVAAALQRTDCGRQRSLDACVDERVAGERTLGVRPPEEVGEERARCVRVCSTDLGVDHWMGHGRLLPRRSVCRWTTNGSRGTRPRQGLYRPKAAACGR